MLFLKSLFVDKFLTVWWAVVVVLLALPFAVWLLNTASEPAQAKACQSFGGHQVCAVSVRRSAARYWEYRTVVSIDGRKQPLELYNCRDRTRTLVSDNTQIPFLTGKTGDWICSLTQPVRSSKLDERVTIEIR
ncbi:MAG: hypothetical protein AAFO06_03730 [Cyanobacteria bacterium J06597_16]